ncbi:MAG: SH3 domain-containing protein, partial [Candidatus Delongbacteria bacterium]|nr:SH3 domain-containing protein [Candidatus Delongbacteria bacterium]
NVRLAHNPNGKITNKLYREQKVHVYEIKNTWARISEYYDGSKEGVSGKVARWVSKKYLSATRPSDKPKQKFSDDPRIKGIPKVPKYGLTERDIQVLYTAAKYFLKKGRCRKIEYGDKSVSKPNTYYLNWGGRNYFFKPSEIPGL